MSERGCCLECAKYFLFDLCETGCVRTEEPELFRIMTMTDEELLAEPNAERDAQEMREAIAKLLAPAQPPGAE